MKKHYDFSHGKRGAVIPADGMTAITLLLEDPVLQAIREQADAEGIGLQTLINRLLSSITPFTTKHLHAP